MRYATTFLDHRRRMQLHTTYARHLILGSASACDVAAQASALLTAAAAGLGAAAWGGTAGYGAPGQATLVLGSAYAVASALWPAGASGSSTNEGGNDKDAGDQDGEDDDEEESAHRRSLAMGKRWTRQARGWLARTRRRLAHGREQQQASAASIRGRDNHKGSHASEEEEMEPLMEAGQMEAIANKSEADMEAGQGAGGEGKRADETSLGLLLTGILERSSARIDAARTAVIECSQQMAARCSASASAAFYIATGLQLIMAATSVRDFHSCLTTPPERPAAYAVLLLCSLIPLVDTLVLYLNAAKVRPLPSKHARGSARSASIDLPSFSLHPRLLRLRRRRCHRSLARSLNAGQAFGSRAGSRCLNR